MSFEISLHFGYVAETTLIIRKKEILPIRGSKISSVVVMGGCTVLNFDDDVAPLAGEGTLAPPLAFMRLH